MAYRTGRGRDFDANGAIAGNVAFGMFSFVAHPPCGLPNTPFAVAAQVAFSSASWIAGGCLFSYDLNGPNIDGDGNYWWGLDLSLVVPGIGGVVDTLTSNALYVFGPYTPYWGMEEVEITGSWSVTFPVEEWIDIADSGDFPDFGGSPLADPPHKTKVTLYEKMVEGGLLAYDLTVNGETLSGSGTITVVSGPSYECSGTVACGNAQELLDCANHTYGASASVSFSYLAADSYSRSHEDLTASLTGGTATIVAASGTEAQDGTLAFGGGPLKSYDLAGQIRAWDGAFPTELTVKVDRAYDDLGHALTTSGGSFADAKTQKNYHAACVLNGIAEGDEDLEPVEIFEWMDLRLWIDPASLTEDRTDDWRVMMRGSRFPALSLVQAASLVVDNGAALTVAAGNYKGAWAAGGSAAVASVGGEIRITSGVGTNSAARSFTAVDLGGNFSGYRYLRLKVRADADDRPFAVEIGSKAYGVDYAGSGLVAGTVQTTLYVDLCAQSASTDSTDTKWPLPTTDGTMYGVTNVASLELTGLDADPAIYYVDEIALCRHPSVGSSRVSVQPALDQWQLEIPPASVGETTTTTYIRRALQGDTDGRLSLEEPDYRKIVIESSGDPVITYPANTIAGVINAVNAAGQAGLYGAPNCPGWTATGTTSASDPGDGGDYADWLNCNRPAHWLYGAGALWDKISPDTTYRWYYGIDRSVSSALDIPAQMVFDELAWYPGCGDVFTASDAPTDATIYLRAAKVMRGQSWGLVFGGGGIPNVGGSLLLKRVSDGATHGTGTTDSRGEYFTGSTWAREGSEYDTILNVGSSPYPTVRRVMYGRYRYRACFGVAPSGGFIAYDVSEANRHARAYIAEGGHIAVGFSPNLLPLTFEDVDSGITGTGPCLAYERYQKTPRLWMTYHDGSTLKLVYTTDEGQSWSSPVTIASSAAHGRFVITRHSTRHFFWIDGAAIKGKVYDGADNVMVDTFTAVASGVDDDAIDCREFQGFKGEHRIGLGYRSGGDLMFVSAADGVTFS